MHTDDGDHAVQLAEPVVRAADAAASEELLSTIRAGVMIAVAGINAETPPCISFDAR
jgi:hypothetical protein